MLASSEIGRMVGRKWVVSWRRVQHHRHVTAGVDSVTGVLAKSAKRCVDGDDSIVEAPTAVYIDSDTSVFMATLW